MPSCWTAGMAKVQIGFFSFTEITDPAEHRSYNEWHQLDHMPEQYPLAGVVFGQRWVSTPACRRARAYDDPDPGPRPLHDPVSHGRARRRHAARSSAPWGSACGPRAGSTSTAGRGCRGPSLSRHAGGAPGARVGARPSPTGPTAASTWWCATAPWHGGGPVPADSARRDVDDEDAAWPTRCSRQDGVAGVWTFATDSRFDRARLAPRRQDRSRSAISTPILSRWRPRLGELVRGAAAGDAAARAVRRSLRDDHPVELGLVRRHHVIGPVASPVITA